MKKEKQRETLAETKLRIIKEDLVSLDVRAKRILEERAELILKLVQTRNAMQQADG
jgi:hypothetical protein